MTMTINNLRKELIQNADEKTKLSGERFFKEKSHFMAYDQLLLSKPEKSILKPFRIKASQISSHYAMNCGSQE